MRIKFAIVSWILEKCQYLLEVCKNSSEQIGDTSTYWNFVETAVNRSETPVLTGTL